MESLILAVDQGTTNSKALLINTEGACIAEGSEPVAVSFPQPGWVEQDPVQIWNSIVAAIDDCLSAAGSPGIAAIAISNQRESALIWDRATGQPLGPLVSWQCRRGAPLCDDLRGQGLAPLVLEKTGLALDPMFTASKYRWLLDSIPDGYRRAEQGEICLGTVDSWLLWNLTGGATHSCDVTNASRSQLFNITTLTWDDELLETFGIPRAALPDVQHSSHIFGEAQPLPHVPGGTPVASMIGDSHGALFGHGGFEPGSVKATYGTGSSLMSPITDVRFSANGISTTVAWGYQQVVHALEGNIYVTGAAVQWLASILGSGDPGHVAGLAETVEGTDGLYLVPAFVGLGAPHWNDRARGLISGMTRGTTAAHLARAVIESIAYQIRDVFDAMSQDAGTDLAVLFADGGASRNDLLMQFQADILGCPVLRNNSTMLSALGAAYLAGLAVDVWPSQTAIADLPRELDRFEPAMSDDQRDRLYSGWQDAIARTAYSPR